MARGENRCLSITHVQQIGRENESADLNWWKCTQTGFHFVSDCFASGIADCPERSGEWCETDVASGCRATLDASPFNKAFSQAWAADHHTASLLHSGQGCFTPLIQSSTQEFLLSSVWHSDSRWFIRTVHPNMEIQALCILPYVIQSPYDFFFWNTKGDI